MLSKSTLHIITISELTKVLLSDKEKKICVSKTISGKTSSNGLYL
jgi:hypothetical protein